GGTLTAEAKRAGHQQVLLAARLQLLDRSGVFLAVALVQLGLRVEQVNLAGAATLEQQDHRFRTAWEIAPAGAQVGRAGRQKPVGLQQGSEGGRSQAKA